MGELSQLPGLGPKSEQWLKLVGIQTEAELRAVGAIEAYLRMQRHAEITPGLNFLYALVGALEGRHWAEVAKTERQRLLFELEDRQQFEALWPDAPPALRIDEQSED